MYLLVDNYDSFTWNIYHSMASQGIKVVVKRNDKININELSTISYKGVIFSPGPGHPVEANSMIEIIKKLRNKIPLLGICLGHQAIAYSYGAKITKMKKVMHGKTDNISIIKKSKIFNKLPKTFIATRYHSLEISYKNLPKSIQILATAKYNTIMGIKIKDCEVYGLQFHPESISSEYGNIIFSNFIRLCQTKK